MTIQSNHRPDATSSWIDSMLGKVNDIQNKLDPVSVLAVLALLRFKPAGTLIGFKGYLMVTELPTAMQGVVRRIFGESREDLAIIPKAIERGAAWFHPEIGGYNDYRDLFEAADKGLTKLQETYQRKQSNVTVAAISEWKKSIQNVIQPSENKPDQPAQKLSRTCEKLRSVWTLAEVKEVNSLIAQMLEKADPPSPGVEGRCADQITRLELLLTQKSASLAKIHEQ